MEIHYEAWIEYYSTLLLIAWLTYLLSDLHSWRYILIKYKLCSAASACLWMQYETIDLKQYRYVRLIVLPAPQGAYVIKHAAGKHHFNIKPYYLAVSSVCTFLLLNLLLLMISYYLCYNKTVLTFFAQRFFIGPRSSLKKGSKIRSGSWSWPIRRIFHKVVQ